MELKKRSHEDQVEYLTIKIAELIGEKAALREAVTGVRDDMQSYIADSDGAIMGQREHGYRAACTAFTIDLTALIDNPE